MEELIDKMTATMNALKADITKVGNKSAQRRARALTLELEKLGKQYRKESIEAEKK